MDKKAYIAALLISVLLVSSALSQFVRVAEANPWFMYHYVTPIPDTIPPAITFNTPTNNSVYSSNDVYINFSIGKPQPPISLTAGVTFISFALDGNATVLYDFFSLPVQSLISPGLREFNYSNTSVLSEGKHSITVYSDGIVLLGNFSIFSVNSSSTINFTINTTSSPSPTQKLTPTPAFTESNVVADPPMDFTPTLMLLAVITFTVAIGIVAYSYFMRTKKRK